MRMLTAARGAVPGLAPGKPNVEYVAMDGTLHAVPLADAARVRLRCSGLDCVSFRVCLGAVPEDVRVRALAAGRADEDAVSLVPGGFEVGYVAGRGITRAG